LFFKGTPYDFRGAVSDFITQYYNDDTAWTGCTFTPQQTGVDRDMPNYAVEIECPAGGGGLPAFVWVTARRLPGGKSKLVITTERYDYDRSPELQATLAGFLEALTGRIATPEDAATAEAEKAAASSTIQAPVLAEKVLELELEAIENDKRYHAQQRARVLLQYTEDPALRARLEAILAMTVRITARVNNFFQDPFRRVRSRIEATPEAEETVSPPASAGEGGAVGEALKAQLTPRQQDYCKTLCEVWDSKDPWEGRPQMVKKITEQMNLFLGPNREQQTKSDLSALYKVLLPDRDKRDMGQAVEVIKSSGLLNLLLD